MHSAFHAVWNLISLSNRLILSKDFGWEKNSFAENLKRLRKCWICFGLFWFEINVFISCKILFDWTKKPKASTCKLQFLKVLGKRIHAISKWVVILGSIQTEGLLYFQFVNFNFFCLYFLIFYIFTMTCDKLWSKIKRSSQKLPAVLLQRI